MKLTRYIIALLAAVAFVACEDRLPYDDYEIGEGEADISATVEFQPIETGLDTRAAGNAVNSINNLWVVLYRVAADGSTEYFDHRLVSSQSDYDYKTNVNSTGPSDAESSSNIGQGDNVTPRATFTIKSVPYGKYQIYAVANVSDLSYNDCKEVETLRGTKFEWKTDVTLDNQMFGYFTVGSDRSSGFTPDQPVTVNNSTVTLHAWIKRLVSKVTISFDPSQLNENVRIYVKSVTIRDIPRYCALGKTNTPTTLSTDSMIRVGESFNYTNGFPENTDHEKWSVILSRGSGPKGEVNHKDSDRALYFFENCQGNYEGQSDYYKPQVWNPDGDKDNVGSAIDDPGTLDDGSANDYKDRVPYGTYIEVEAFYDSRNKDKISQGPIKYRFMLGKNITYNYNAERNFHYKLTLKFRGWANEADWHISYDEPTPTFITPEPYYISYLYNQKMEFPVRVYTGNESVKNYIVKAEIVENNWWPWKITKKSDKGVRPDEFVPAGLTGQRNINGFAWNMTSFNNIYPYRPYTYAEYIKNPENFIYSLDGGSNYVGFLSLKPCHEEEIGQNYPGMGTGSDSNGYGPKAKEFLQTYYHDNQLASMEYSLTGPGTSFDEVDNSVSLMVPMYTRNKDMVSGTDFTGNNPFGIYWRFARVRWTLYEPGNPNPVEFEDEYGNKAKERLSTIYQVPRIENPKAIYRAHDNTDPFEVKLMIRADAGSDTYMPFASDGPWRASILAQTESFIQLSHNGKTVKATGAYIEGSTDEEVAFTYTPAGEIASNKTRCGIIKVEYHDYNCVHLIFVRQGYHAGVTLGDAKWSCYNVYATSRGGSNRDSYVPGTETSVDVALTASPLSIGSFLKRNQYNYSIREYNNTQSGLSWLDDITDKNLSTSYIDANKNVQTRNALWKNIQGFAWTNYYSSTSSIDERVSRKWADTWTSVTDIEKGEEFDVPTGKDYESLINSCGFGFGIAYADGSTTTSESFANTSGFVDYNNDGKDDAPVGGESRGVRVCVVYDENTGNNILFPLGSTGQGRRARNGAFVQRTTEEVPWTTNRSSGALAYGGVCTPLYNTSTNASNVYRPLTFNLYRSPGAVYWIKQPVTNNTASNLANANQALYASWDLNYSTIRFYSNDYGSLGGWDGKKYTFSSLNATNCSDAIPLKLIYKKK